MSDKFIRAYESYLQTATEPTWPQAARAAKEYAQLADPSVNVRELGPLTRQMATVAQRLKKPWEARTQAARAGSRVEAKRPDQEAPRRAVDFSAVDADFAMPALPASKGKSQMVADKMRDMQVGEVLIVALDSKEEVNRFHSILPIAERILGWKRIDGAPSYQAETLKYNAAYLNGTLKTVYLMRVGRVS